MDLVAWLWAPFKITEVTLCSPHSPQECTGRLAAAIDPWMAWPFPFSRKPVRGSVGTSSFVLSKRIFYRNSFQTTLTGRLGLAPGGGATITCEAGLGAVTRIFMYIWFGLVGLFVVMALGSALIDPQHLTPTPDNPLNSSPSVLVIGLVMQAFGWGFVALGRYFASGEEAFLLSFVAELTDARRA